MFITAGNQRTRRKSLLDNSKSPKRFWENIKKAKGKEICNSSVISAETWREYFESLFTDLNADHVYDNIFESVGVTRDNDILDS